MTYIPQNIKGSHFNTSIDMKRNCLEKKLQIVNVVIREMQQQTLT